MFLEITLKIFNLGKFFSLSFCIFAEQKGTKIRISWFQEKENREGNENFGQVFFFRYVKAYNFERD